jgi:hypothetical protein
MLARPFMQNAFLAGTAVAVAVAVPCVRRLRGAR